MTQIIGINGVYITPIISGAATFIVAILIWRKTIKSLDKQIEYVPEKNRNKN